MRIEIGFFGLLTLIFVVAKLSGFITWSWWLVFLPAIVGLAITLFILIFVFGIIFLVALR